MFGPPSDPQALDGAFESFSKGRVRGTRICDRGENGSRVFVSHRAEHFARGRFEVAFDGRVLRIDMARRNECAGIDSFFAPSLEALANRSALVRSDRKRPSD